MTPMIPPGNPATFPKTWQAMAGHRLAQRARRTAQAQPTRSVANTIGNPPLMPAVDHNKGTCIEENRSADETIAGSNGD